MKFQNDDESHIRRRHQQQQQVQQVKRHDEGVAGDRHSLPGVVQRRRAREVGESQIDSGATSRSQVGWNQRRWIHTS